MLVIRYALVKAILICTCLPLACGRRGFDRVSSLAENRMVSANDAIISCYYSYGDDIDPTLCTHLIVSGALVSFDGTVSFLNSTACRVIVGLKVRNPGLKIMITGSGDMRTVMKDQAGMNKFADQIVDFLRQSNFDGFDLDWEINTLSPISPSYKAMGDFFKILREKVQKEPRKVILTAAVFAVPLPSVHSSYNVSALNESLDFINLMTYDFDQYLPTQPYTGHNSPLFKRPYEFWIFGHMNTAWAALNWYKSGMDHKKIAVGIPTYGHTYKLLFRWWHSLRAPATGVGPLGRFVTYAQVCNLLRTENYTRIFDDYAKVPYCYKDQQWISYDDLESVAAKADWIKQQGFGGAMIYDFHFDDPRGECDGKTTFPLHRKVWSILKG